MRPDQSLPAISSQLPPTADVSRSTAVAINPEELVGFSYRWSQILEMDNIPAATTVLKARPVETGRQAAYAPPPLDEVLAAIAAHKPQIVFAPHVETSIASGTLWVDMHKVPWPSSASSRRRAAASPAT